MSEAPEVALLSIHPKYANAIFSGRKRVEFRRRPLSRSVSHVVVYATLPEARVVGVCRVIAQHQGSPNELWQRFADCGEISRADFFAYFSGRSEAVAIELESPTRFDPTDGLTLADLGASRPPQSFQYISNRGRGKVLELAG